MRKALVASMLIFFFSILFTGLMPAQGLRILTEEDPPYNFQGKDGQPTGFAVEVCREIQYRTGNKDPIEIVPWARAWDTILSQDRVVLFTMARTRERETLFQWLGPLMENRWVLVALKSRHLNIPDLEAAKKLGSIGVVRDFAWDKYLQEQGFKNLQQVVKNTQNVLKVQSDRIQAYVSNDNSWIREIVEAGLDPSKFEIVYTIKSVWLYIAHSAGTPHPLVEAWKKAFDAMKADGTFRKIYGQWFPGRKLPGHPD